MWVGILFALSVLGTGIMLWLQFVHGIRYFGPVPSSVLYFVPFLLACWLVVWPRRKTLNSRMFFIFMVLATILGIVGMLLTVRWS